MSLGRRSIDWLRSLLILTTNQNGPLRATSSSFRSGHGPARSLREERCGIFLVEDAHERADFAVERRREAEQRHEIGQHGAALDGAHVTLWEAARFGEHDLRETALFSHLADTRPEQFGSARHF